MLGVLPRTSSMGILSFWSGQSFCDGPKCSAGMAWDLAALRPDRQLRGVVAGVGSTTSRTQRFSHDDRPLYRPAYRASSIRRGRSATAEALNSLDQRAIPNRRTLAAPCLADGRGAGALVFSHMLSGIMLAQLPSPTNCATGRHVIEWHVLRGRYAKQPLSETSEPVQGRFFIERQTQE